MKSYRILQLSLILHFLGQLVATGEFHLGQGSLKVCGDGDEEKFPTTVTISSKETAKFVGGDPPTTVPGTTGVKQRLYNTIGLGEGHFVVALSKPLEESEKMFLTSSKWGVKFRITAAEACAFGVIDVAVTMKHLLEGLVGADVCVVRNDPVNAAFEQHGQFWQENFGQKKFLDRGRMESSYQRVVVPKAEAQRQKETDLEKQRSEDASAAAQETNENELEGAREEKRANYERAKEQLRVTREQYVLILDRTNASFEDRQPLLRIFDEKAKKQLRAMAREGQISRSESSSDEEERAEYYRKTPPQQTALEGQLTREKQRSEDASAAAQETNENGKEAHDQPPEMSTTYELRRTANNELVNDGVSKYQMETLMANYEAQERRRQTALEGQLTREEQSGGGVVSAERRAKPLTRGHLVGSIEKREVELENELVNDGVNIYQTALEGQLTREKQRSEDASAAAQETNENEERAEYYKTILAMDLSPQKKLEAYYAYEERAKEQLMAMAREGQISRSEEERADYYNQLVNDGVSKYVSVSLAGR
eukprot:GHVS01088590.1.p1 GENE.GHVS01088590.1~~GHVS01088590.1.p1  ORF type:complete len:540 (-),score=90.08 GHVS01088590.1:51-1670(-)